MKYISLCSFYRIDGVVFVNLNRFHCVMSLNHLSMKSLWHSTRILLNVIHCTRFLSFPLMMSSNRWLGAKFVLWRLSSLNEGQFTIWLNSWFSTCHPWLRVTRSVYNNSYLAHCSIRINQYQINGLVSLFYNLRRTVIDVWILNIWVFGCRYESERHVRDCVRCYTKDYQIINRRLVALFIHKTYDYQIINIRLISQSICQTHARVCNSLWEPCELNFMQDALPGTNHLFRHMVGMVTTDPVLNLCHSAKDHHHHHQFNVRFSMLMLLSH